MTPTLHGKQQEVRKIMGLEGCLEDYPEPYSCIGSDGCHPQLTNVGQCHKPPILIHFDGLYHPFMVKGDVLLLL